MALFVHDVSDHQPSFNFAAAVAAGAAAFLVKVSEGGRGSSGGWYYRNPDLGLQLGRAQATGALVVGYHYVRGTDWLGQADNVDGWAPAGLPIALDVEAGGDLATAARIAAELRRRGRVVPLLYCPRWWIASNGGEGYDTRPIAPLWSSAYPVGYRSSAAATYAAAGGDAGSGWSPYGQQTPVLWQFADDVLAGGYPTDTSAWRGTRQQLAAALGLAPHQQHGEDEDMYRFLVDEATDDGAGGFTRCAEQLPDGTLIGTTWPDIEAKLDEFHNKGWAPAAVRGVATSVFDDYEQWSDRKKAAADALVKIAGTLAAGGSAPVPGGPDAAAIEAAVESGVEAGLDGVTATFHKGGASA
jgi:hypothetical protein